MTSYIITTNKIKNLDGKVYHSRFLSGITIVISIPCNTLDSHILSQLKSRRCEEDKGVLYKNTELTVLFHALYADICSKLTLPGSVKSTGITGVDCHYHNKQFNLVFSVGKGTGSAARKVVSDAFKFMKPDKLRSSYEMMLRSMGLKPKREEYNWCLSQVNNALKANIQIFIVGKINLGKTSSIRSDKLKVILTSAAGKFTAAKNESPATAPDSRNNAAAVTPPTSISISGINGFYLQQYAGFLTKNAILTEIANDKLVFHSPRFEWVMSRLRKKDALKRYVTQKYGKAKDGLTAVVLKAAADTCTADAKTLFSVSSKILKPSDISDAMISALK